MNTLDSLVFIRTIHPIKIEVESDEHIFSMPKIILQNEFPNLVLNFYSAYQRINEISEMNTRLIQASRM